MINEGVAKLIQDNLPGFNGHAQLWRVNPPLEGYRWNEKEDVPSYEYVVVSGVSVMYSGYETYIFGSDKNGNILDWGELPGSFRGDIDHEQAIRGAGYDTLIYETTKESKENVTE